MTALEPVRASDSALKVAMSLKQHGVAVLVDSEDRPIGILTACDANEALRRLRSAGGPDAKAEALFQTTGIEVVDVVVDTEPVDAVLALARAKRRSTGITIVDRRGRYRGYVFLVDLANQMSRSLDLRKEELSRRTANLRSSHPELGVELDRVQQKVDKLHHGTGD